MLSLVLSLVVLLLSKGSCATININNSTTDLAHLVSSCSDVGATTNKDTHSSASGSGSIDSPDNTRTACDTMDIVLHTHLQLDSPVTFHNLTYTSIQGANRTVTLTCTTTGAGLVFSNTQHIQLRSLKLVGCAVIKNYTVRRLINGLDETLTYSGALHIEETENVSISNVDIVASPGVGILLINNSGLTSITDCNFKANKLPESLGHQYGGGGVYLYIRRSLPESEFLFSNCTFVGNIAANTINISYVYVDEFGDLISGRGRGGGIFVTIQRNVSNVTVVVSDCFFAHNSAFGGGGLSAEMEHGYARNNVMLVRSSVFLHNGCQEGSTSGVGSGGGTQLSFFSLDPDSNTDNLFMFQNVLFSENCGFLGGGVYFFSNFDSHPHINNQLIFDNCSWIQNHAQTGSAVDMNPSIFERLDSGYSSEPVFRNCRFINNSVVTFARDSSDQLQHYGTGTLYSSLYNIRFESSVEFLGNFGTAVYIVNGIADFTGGSALFDSNVGIQGGGVALIGASSMLIGPHNYTFTNNVATDRGGAIYSYLIDSHDFVVSRSCFMQYTEAERRIGITATQWGIHSILWKARVHFEGNEAGSQQGNDIFTSSLLPCQVVRNASGFQVLDLTDIFHPPGVTFGGQPPKGLRISTDGAGFVNSTGRLAAIPGENFQHGVRVVDDLDQVITSTLVADFPPFDNKTSSIELDFTTFLTNQAIQFRGKPHEEDNLVVQVVNARRIFLSVDVEMLDCPPGYILQENQCVCDAQSHIALVRCNDTHLHSYLRTGYWVGYTNSTAKDALLLSAVCPLEFCNYHFIRNDPLTFEVALTRNRKE